MAAPGAPTAQFRDLWYAKAPPWLRTGNAERYMYTLQLCSDVLLEKCYQAIAIRFPGIGDATQIPYLAHDRNLLRGPNEPDSQFVARLRGAFQAWNLAGSRISVLGQLQAYMTGLQPGVDPTLPVAAIVGGSYPTVSTWATIYGNTPSIALDGGAPSLVQARPANFDWDGGPQPWRAWLVLYQHLVATGQSGAAAAIASASGGSFKSPGQNVGGVWVPATSGTPVNSPFLTVTGLSGLTSSNARQWLTLAGSSHGSNNTTVPIVEVLGASSCIVANPLGAVDAGPLTWSIGFYPWIGPSMPWGMFPFDGSLIGAGEASPPPLDTGQNIGGVWQPSKAPFAFPPSESWGLDVPAATIETVRLIVGGPGRGWKSAGTWYVDIIVAFDGGDGTAGKAYSPLSSPGSGNPDGTFGGRGKLVGGVWVPNRLVSSPYDGYCQGTGGWSACSVPNQT